MVVTGMASLHIILVAIDGSAEAGRALKFAAKLAKKQTALLIILHVVSPFVRGRERQELETLERIEHNERTEYEMLQERGRGIIGGAEQVAQEKGAPHVEALVEVGDDPAELILRIASSRGAGMIVLGRRGSGKFASTILGSVTYKITHTSKLPVVIVP